MGSKKVRFGSLFWSCWPLSFARPIWASQLARWWRFRLPVADNRFSLWSGKIAHVLEQPNPRPTTTERAPWNRSYWSPRTLEPALHSKRKKERKWSRSVVSDSSRPHGLQPTRLLHPWASPGKSTGVGCHFLLRRSFLIQGSNPGLQHCRQTLYHLSHQGTREKPPQWEARTPRPGQSAAPARRG